MEDFGFNDNSLFGNDGSGALATPAQQAKITSNDSAWMTNLTNLIGIGVSAYGTVEAAKAQASANKRITYANEARKVAAPVIATPSPAVAGIPKGLLYAAGAVVALLFGLLLIRRR